jgi:hypothetical protein
MANEVRVTTSQADAAKMIVERDRANGKHTPEAIRKIAAAQAEPVAETAGRRRPNPGARGGRKRLRVFWTRLSSGRA